MVGARKKRGLYAIVPKMFQSIDIGLFENYHAYFRRLPATAAKRPLCARPTAMSDSATYRNVIYRLLPGDAATANQLLGIWDACRFTWNEIKEAREIQYEHACGRKIASPTFFTLRTAFKTLWDQTEWLRKHSYTIVRYTLRYQADAWTAFFKGRAGSVTITLLTRAVLCGTHDACRLACDSFARKLFRGLSARSLREARAGARLRASCALARTGATRGASRAFRRRGRSCRGWRRNWG